MCSIHAGSLTRYLLRLLISSSVARLLVFVLFVLVRMIVGICSGSEVNGVLQCITESAWTLLYSACAQSVCCTPWQVNHNPPDGSYPAELLFVLCTTGLVC